MRELQPPEHDIQRPSPAETPLSQPAMPSPAAVVALQRQFGNRVVQRIVGRRDRPAAAARRAPLDKPIRDRIEAVAGLSLADVEVHYNSPEPAQVDALAFARGSEIHLGPGQERHLPHEAWHIVQQKQGRVQPTTRVNGTAVNDDPALEAEATRMAHRAVRRPAPAIQRTEMSTPTAESPGRYRIVAGVGGQQAGSLLLHAGGATAVEVTDLHVDPAHRKQGLGQDLLASAAATGQQMGKSSMTLAAQDSGSGRLTRWYRDLGFVQTGVNRLGYPKFEASLARLAAIRQNRSAVTQTAVAQHMRKVGAAEVRDLIDYGDLGERRGGAAPAAAGVGVPPGYVSLQEFNKTVNIYGKYSGLVSKNYTHIYVKIVDDKPFLWWSNPKKQIDNFVYTGKSADDIAQCNSEQGHAEGYTWHHTGHPHASTHGTMQLVPTAEHESISHYGGAWLAYREK